MPENGWNKKVADQRMIKVYLIFLSLLIASFSFSQELTTVILLRHAEKAQDDPKNPTLSKKGSKRVEKLNELLKETSIDAFYSTNFKRTKQTIAALAQLKKATVNIYLPFEEGLLRNLVNKHQGKTDHCFRTFQYNTRLCK